MKRILIILSLVFFLLSLGNAQLRVDSLKADQKIIIKTKDVTTFFDSLNTSNQITTKSIENDAVTGAKIENRTIQAIDIELETITDDELAEDCIETGHLSDGCVNEFKIASSGVATTNIQDSAVTTAKIDDDAVTAAKINFIYTGEGSPEGVVSAVVGSLYLNTLGSTSTTLYVKESGLGNTGWVNEFKIATSGVATTNIQDSAVTTAKIDDDAVTSAKILDSTITAVDCDTSLLNRIGGDVTNNPDNVTLENKGGSTIGLKDSIESDIIVKGNFTSDKIITTMNVHAFDDHGELATTTSQASNGYSSYDTYFNVNNTDTVNHVNGYQSRIQYNNTGGIGSVAGMSIHPKFNSTGKIGTYCGLGIHFDNDTQPVNTAYGININAGEWDYSILATEGNAHFGDSVGFGVLSPAYQIDAAGIANFKGNIRFAYNTTNTAFKTSDYPAIYAAAAGGIGPHAGCGDLIIQGRSTGSYSVAIATGSTPALRMVVDETGDVEVGGTINFATDAQANDDYEIAISTITALKTGLTVTFIANTANTDGATLEITSVGDVDAILKHHDQALVTGDIEAGQVVVCVFDGTNWQMTSQLAQ